MWLSTGAQHVASNAIIMYEPSGYTNSKVEFKWTTVNYDGHDDVTGINLQYIVWCACIVEWNDITLWNNFERVTMWLRDNFETGWLLSSGEERR